MSLYSNYFGTDELLSHFSDSASIARLLSVEAALVRAQAKCGIVPAPAAEVIVGCCKAEWIDLEKLKHDIKLGGNAAIPLVKQLTRLVKNASVEAAKFVHLGATSQDIVDTATVLLIRQFDEWLHAKLLQIGELLLHLTQQHRDTVMIGRTLMQQARPLTFGLKSAHWLSSIGRALQRLHEARKRILVVQLAGAVGTGNASITKEVVHEVAELLDLEYALSWQSQRDSIAEFASLLGILSGSLGKIARDLVLLMQTEVGEVLEGAAEGKGGSSTMPHKRNPVTAAAIIANANRVPHLVASLLAAMPQEHERSAGLWHSEWETLTELMMLTGGIVERSVELLGGLEVNKERMKQNLELTNGLIYAENVSLSLAPSLGKIQAHELVEKACKSASQLQMHLKQVLREWKVPIANLDELFDPHFSIGNSTAIIDEIVNQWKSTTN